LADKPVFAYIGTLDQGGTCRMRGEIIASILSSHDAVFIDTRYIFKSFNRLIQSLGFRYKIGPLVKRVNGLVRREIGKSEFYDMIWVDKAIYLHPSTTKILRNKTKCLIHYTPDTAFFANKSRYFNRSMGIYSYLVTTKSYDLPFYRENVPDKYLILTTQGFDPRYHRSSYTFEEKEVDVAFIGLYEPHREKVLQLILDNGFTLVLAGHGWDRFAVKNRANESFKFAGRSIQKEAYGKLISSARFSPGLLSKKFPEKHTTRTFEIPACGTALLTEYNEETSTFYAENEAIFYNDEKEMIRKMIYYRDHADKLKILTVAGMQRITENGPDYRSVLFSVLHSTSVLRPELI